MAGSPIISPIALILLLLVALLVYALGFRLPARDGVAFLLACLTVAIVRRRYS